MSADARPTSSDWDAARYDRVADPQTAWGAVVLDRLPLRGDERVLDAGCGTGRVTELLAARLPDGHVVALDASGEMLDAARGRLAPLGDRVTFVRADLVEPLPAAVGRVDAILSTATFHWVLDHDALFLNLGAVLRPGGRLVAQCGGAGNVATLEAAIEAMGLWPRGRYTFATPQETAARLRAAGFTDVETWLSAEPTTFAPGEPFEAFLETVCLRDVLSRVEVAERAAIVREVAARLPGPVLDYVRLNIVATKADPSRLHSVASRGPAARTSARRGILGPVTTDAADLVLAGGPVHTIDAARSTARALAVRGGRIVAVGTPIEVDRLVGPRTRRIDLRGRAVVPGFQDAHCHPTHGGMAMLRCELHEARGRDTVLAIIHAYAASHPDAEWITGGGWAMADFPGGTPSRGDLDAVVPDRPAFLTNRDGHGAWVNSRALELAGVTAETTDPPDGRIERAPGGDPSGTLHDGAMELVRRLIPPNTAEDWADALRLGQAHLHALGITGWQDAIVEPDDQAAYETLAGRGELTARVVGALWWDRTRGLEQIEALVERRASGAVGRFAPTSVKIMQDGVLESFTGALLEPYVDRDGRSGESRGPSFVDPEVLGPAVTRLDAEGFQVHFHAIGDRAVREALDAVAVARSTNGWTDTRPHIAHIQVIHPDDVPRFAGLGVAANAQPFWAVHEEQMDALTIPFLGPQRSAWQYPFRSLRRTGAVLAGGSDWPVTTANPLREIEVMVTRVPDENRAIEPFLPGERLDPIDAVAAFTAGSAWVNHLEQETGTLEVGKAADLVVLDRDILDLAAGPIADARVVGTWVAGDAVHADPSLDG